MTKANETRPKLKLKEIKNDQKERLMKQAERLIRTMSKVGNSSSAIAQELFTRGIKNGLGRTYTVGMIEGFLGYTGLEDERLAMARKKRGSQAPAVFPPSLGAVSPCSKDAKPVADPLPKVRMMRAWPLHTDFSRDNLDVLD